MSARLFLTGKRIYLRGLERSDVSGNYGRWFNDPEVCRFNAHHRFPYGQEELLEYVDGLSNARDRLVLAIIEDNDDRHIGNISLQAIDSVERSAEFAIIIGEKAAWGKGYSKEAARLIINHGFGALNLHRIYCGTSAENIPMQKLALSMGFLQEGRRREALYKNFRYEDILEYGLLRTEWKQTSDVEAVQ